MSRAARRRRSRERVAYLASKGEYVALADRYVAPDDGPSNRARLYRVDVQRDGKWRGVGEFGDVFVAAEHAKAVRTYDARTVGCTPAATRVVHCKVSQMAELSPPKPVSVADDAAAQQVEVRPIGPFADNVSGPVGKRPDELAAERSALRDRFRVGMLQTGLRALCVPGAAEARAVARGVKALRRAPLRWPQQHVSITETGVGCGL